MDSGDCENPLGDIEDIIGLSDPTPRDRFAGRDHIVPKAKRKKRQDVEQNGFVEPVVADSVIPGIRLKKKSY